jgi:hypothetical protein
MSNVAGRDLLIKVKIAGHNTAIAGQQGGGISIKGTPIETSNKADFPVTKRVVGWVDWELNFDSLVDLTDAALDEVVAAANGGLAVEVQCAVGSDTYIGSGIIQGYDEKGGKTDMAAASGTIVGAGALVVATAATVTATLVEVNAEKVLLAGVALKNITVYDFSIAVVGNWADCTAVVIEDETGTDVATIGVAALTDGAIITPITAGVVLGAGYQAPLTVAEALVINKTGGAATGGTSLAVTLYYAQAA